MSFKSWYYLRWGFPGSSVVNNLPTNAEDTGDTDLVPGWGRSLEEEMATHSSILAPRTEEPGVLQSTGSQRDTTEHALFEVTAFFFSSSLTPFLFWSINVKKCRVLGLHIHSHSSLLDYDPGHRVKIPVLQFTSQVT